MKTLLKPSHIGLSLLLLMSGIPGAFADSETVEMNFDISDSGWVSVENVNGKISVSTWDGDGVKLEAVKSANSDEGLDGIKVNTRSSDDSLVITTTLPKKRGWFWRSKNYNAKVDYVLHVPASVRLRNVASVNGSVSIQGVQGGVHASTVNGGIHSSGLNGPIELSTVNGSVKCETAASSREDAVEISTVNGSITLKLPAVVGADLKAGTVNGSIRSDLPFSRTDVSGRRKVRATIGDGGLPVELSTVNGSIRIEKSDSIKVSTR